MNVQISYKAPKTPDLEREFKQQIEKLGKRLQAYRPDMLSLHGGVVENSAREGLTVSLNLRLPSGQLAARGSGASAASVVKGAFADLLHQLETHKARLRNKYRWPRVRRTGKTMPAQVPFEETLAAVHPEGVSDADITTYINANLSRLQRYVERELRYRQGAGTITPDQVTREEVIDQAVAMALSDGDGRPEKLALEAWLYRLAMRALNEVANANGDHGTVEVRLEGSARQQNVEASDEARLQFHQPDEMLHVEDTLADRRVSTPEQIAATDEMIDQVEFALAGATPKQREAFILSAIEGFTVGEIAGITDQPEDKVREHIQKARDLVRRLVGPQNEFRDHLLQNKIA